MGICKLSESEIVRLDQQEDGTIKVYLKFTITQSQEKFEAPSLPSYCSCYKKITY